MRKIVYILLVLSILSVQNALAVFSPITVASGVQVVAGITVTVTPNNSPWSGISGCGVGPYGAGKYTNKSDGYTFNFSTPVTHVRFDVTEINNGDSILFSINGVPRVLTAANLIPFVSTCGSLPNAIASNGYLTSFNTNGGLGSGVSVILDNGVTGISSASVLHVWNSVSPLPDGVILNANLQDDSCRLPFKVTVDSPACTNRSIYFHATQFPNTTYTWAGPAGYAGTGSDPVLNIGPSPVAQSGKYWVTAIRGACLFTDTIQNLFIDLTPSKPLIVHPGGPKCPDQEDSIQAQSTGINYHWWGPGNFTSRTADSQTIVFTSLQPSDAGTYFVYSSTTIGCRSDTSNVTITVNPDVTASFTYDHNYYGCIGDTVTFHNKSTVDNPANPNNQYRWFFGDVNNTVAIDPDKQDTFFVYPTRPKIDLLPVNYNVRLVVTNGLCFDTARQVVTVSHPLAAQFTVDDDSVCKGDTVVFRNESVFEDGTLPLYKWEFGDGDTSDSDIDSVKHKYVQVGVYDSAGPNKMRLIITDYLGCKDTAYHTILIDSTGSLTFDVSDSTICLGETILFTGVYSSVGANSASWDLGDGVTVSDTDYIQHAFDVAGTYDVTFAADYRICPDISVIRKIVVSPYPTVDLGPDTTICPNGKPLVLTELLNEANPDATYRWNTPTKDSGRTLIVRHPGIYGVTVTANGCSNTDSVEIFKNCYIDIPNVFTPDGDGQNDYFLPRQFLSKDVSKFKMAIYDRWGVKVFETTSLNGRGWDGRFNDKDQPSGVYIYLIEVNFINNTSEKYQGNLTMLR